MYGLTGSAKVIELNVEPFVNLCVKFMIFLTDLFRSGFLLQSFDLSRSPILICATNEHHIIPSHSTIPGIAIRTQNAADDVTKMRSVVHIG